MQITTTLRNVPDSAKLVEASATMTKSAITGEVTIWFCDSATGKSFMVVLSQKEAAGLSATLV